MDDNQLYLKYSHIRPIYEGYYVKIPKDLNIPYTLQDRYSRKVERAPHLYVAYKFNSVHSFTYYCFFKPTIKEVWEQIPENYDIKDIVAFEVIGPQSIEMNKHKAICILYRKF